MLSSKDFSKIQDSQKTPLPEKHVSIHTFIVVNDLYVKEASQIIIHFHLSLSASTICFGLNTRYGIMCKQFPVVILRRVVQICALYVVLLADSIFCTEISDLVQTSAGKIIGCSDMRPRI